MIDPSDLLAPGGIGGVILLAMSRMMARQTKAEAKERATWELLIEEKVKGLDDRVKGLNLALTLERDTREELHTHLGRAMDEVRETSAKMTKYMEAMRGFVESCSKRLGAVEKTASDVTWLSNQVRIIREKKGAGGGGDPSTG